MGKELSYGSYSRVCERRGAGGTALDRLVCQAKITMPVSRGRFLALDFITTLDRTLRSGDGLSLTQSR